MKAIEIIKEMRDDFRTELQELINKHSVENGSNTPDWILAYYLKGCLSNFDNTVNLREKWYLEKKTEYLF